MRKKTWRERLAGWFARPARSKRRRRAWLFCEELAARCTPTTFTWLDLDNNNGQWEDPKNWGGGDGQTNYPGWNGTQATTGDVAVFNGSVSDNCTMAKPHTLNSISIGPNIRGVNYTGTLTLQDQLTLSGGASSMISGTILQTKTGNNVPAIDIQNLTSFIWGGGDINPTGTVSTFTVESGGNFTLSQSSSASKFGDNLNNSGLVVLANTNVGGDTLVNQPTITNNSGAEIRITADNTPMGLGIPTGDPVVTIQNSGLIDKTGTTGGTYVIADPVNNKAASASISVQNGTLRFKGANADGFSISQSLGTIQLSRGTTLQPDYGLYQTGGTTIGLGNSTINATVKTTGGTLQQGDGTAGNVGTLTIKGNLNFQGGTLYTFYDTGAKQGGLFSVSGGQGVTLNAAATTISVDMIGTGNTPGQMDVMQAIGNGASISDPTNATVNGTAGYKKAFLQNFGNGTNNDLWVKKA
jgi:hypothetical protein